MAPVKPAAKEKPVAASKGKAAAKQEAPKGESSSANERPQPSKTEPVTTSKRSARASRNVTEV